MIIMYCLKAKVYTLLFVAIHIVSRWLYCLDPEGSSMPRQTYNITAFIPCIFSSLQVLGDQRQGKPDCYNAKVSSTCTDKG